MCHYSVPLLESRVYCLAHVPPSLFLAFVRDCFAESRTSIMFSLLGFNRYCLLILYCFAELCSESRTFVSLSMLSIECDSYCSTPHVQAAIALFYTAITKVTSSSFVPCA